MAKTSLAPGKKLMFFNYTVGYMGIALITNVVVTWAMYFYSPPLESGRITYMPAALFGLVMALGRIVDAITDPLVSVWSDNLNTPYGRRIPFIAAGAVPTVLAFIFLWYPPVEGSTVLNVIYLTLVLGMLFFGLTVITCPFLALMPEIAPTSRERMWAAEGIALAHIAGLGIAMLVSTLLIEEYGFKLMAIILGVVALGSFAIPVLTVKEKYQATAGDPYNFRQSIAFTFKNKVFLPYIGSLPFFWFGFNIVLMGIPYIITVQVGLSESRAGVALGAALVVALISFPLVGKISNLKGKKFTFCATMIFSSILLISMVSIGHWPLPISATYQAIIIIALAGIPLAGLFILPNALLADITDADYQVTGKRREGIYYGMQGLVMKSTIGLSAFFLGILLETFGYTSSNPLGVILIGPVAGICILIGVSIFRYYPLK